MTIFALLTQPSTIVCNIFKPFLMMGVMILYLNIITVSVVFFQINNIESVENTHYSLTLDTM